MLEHPTVSAVRDFNAKHGESYTSGGSVYYIDGSMREIGPWGVMYDATKADQRDAKQEWQVQSNIVTYYRLKLEQAVQAFDELNTRLQSWLPANPEAEIANLRRLQALVAKRKPELAKAEAALANTKLGKLATERREAEQERKQQAAEFQERRRTIRI